MMRLQLLGYYYMTPGLSHFQEVNLTFMECDLGLYTEKIIKLPVLGYGQSQKLLITKSHFLNQSNNSLIYEKSMEVQNGFAEPN